MRSSIARTSSLLLPLVVGAACSELEYQQLAPDRPYLVGIYDWEVPHETKGMLVLRSPADSGSRDTLLADTGYLIECTAADADGPLLCGSFFFQPSRRGVIGHFERCYTNMVTNRSAYRDPPDQARQYIYAASQACDTVRMGVWKRTANVERP